MMTTKRNRSKNGLILMKLVPNISWVKLACWVTISAVLVYGAVTNTIANITRRKNPDVALAFVRSEPVALTLNAERQFLASQAPSSLTKVERWTRRALVQQPLNPSAVRLLGYVADVRGKTHEAEKRIRLSASLSRRDFGAQLWLIEAAVRDGKNKDALTHYDIALRSVLNSRSVLFPTLTEALADREIRAAFVPYVRAAPNWMSAFLYDAIATTDNPENIAAVLMSAGKLPAGKDYRAVPVSLLYSLAAKSKFDAFQQYYTSLSGASRETLNSVGLTSATVNLRYAAAGWQILDAAAVGGGFAEKEVPGQFRFNAFAGSGERGAIMHKYLFLAPGNYRLFVEHKAVESAPDANAEWIVQCLSNQTATGIGTAMVPIREGTFTAQTEFTVAPGCPAQLLLLRAAGGSGQSGAEFTVERITLGR